VLLHEVSEAAHVLIVGNTREELLDNISKTEKRSTSLGAARVSANLLLNLMKKLIESD